jgi:outer membrane receptor protein involved in Fe transport
MRLLVARLAITLSSFLIGMLVCAPLATAQQSTGNIAGRVVDEQNASVVGATVTARNVDTGFAREVTSDSNGLYLLSALPVGMYDVAGAHAGLSRFERSGIVVNVARTTDLEIVMRVAPLAETVAVTAVTPLVSVTSSTLGQVVETTRIESLPLNGRQFANLAATVPGVGLGFHSEPTKSTQYSPQISGGNGRNVNYVIDGGDNNDDTAGGALQLFPLEAIEEFNVMTHRFDAEHGRGGAVLNVVTKSGTNDLRGSWFSLFRDDGLNAQTFTERSNDIRKQDYRRHQFGGSVGGPLVPDKVHYFGAYERTQQDTRQVVSTLGLYPSEDGVYDVPFREILLTGKVTVAATPTHWVSLRYARDSNSQPTGATLRAARSSWATSYNTYDSVNVNHNWVVGQSSLNEFVFQYSNFLNDIPATSVGPSLRFPNGVTGGTSLAAPQSTEQTKWQLRDDISWTATGAGLGHQFRAGVNWIHEPHLFVNVAQGTGGVFTMGANDVNGPVTSILVIGGNTELNIPIDSYSLYVQDDWRASNRLTLNLGVRWDYVNGIPFDQSRNPNFQALQAAGRTGRFVGTALEDFGEETRGDRNNVQPRLGFVYDLHGAGREVIRGGWGIYSDFAYTNANVLTAAIDAAGGGGPVFVANAPAGIRRPDGSFFRVADPLSIIASQNSVNPNIPPLAGEVVSPRLEQPETSQVSLGWAREIDPLTSVSADYVHVDGRNLNLRLRPNTIVGGRRYLADLPIQPPNSITFRTAISKGTSHYDGLILAVRRRATNGLDLNAWYTLAKATSDVGTAYDEIVQNLIQDVTNPFGPVQDGPSTRTDARHLLTVSAVVEAPWGLRFAPMFFYRSALPTHSFEGLDLNADGNVNDKTAIAYRFTGLNDNGSATFEEHGNCETVNCSRRASFSQLNIRVSRVFPLWREVRIEAIAELFNVFNATNPSIPLSTPRLSSNGVPLSSFMQPTAFAGDVQQPEQRVGQIGFRVTF